MIDSMKWEMFCIYCIKREVLSLHHEIWTSRVDQNKTKQNKNKNKKNCGKFWKRWEYQTTWPASWETYMPVRKQQLELDMEQKTGSK